MCRLKANQKTFEREVHSGTYKVFNEIGGFDSICKKKKKKEKEKEKNLRDILNGDLFPFYKKTPPYQKKKKPNQSSLFLP